MGVLEKVEWQHSGSHGSSGRVLRKITDCREWKGLLQSAEDPVICRIRLRMKKMETLRILDPVSPHWGEASLGWGLTGARPHWGEASLGRGLTGARPSLGRGLTGARPHWGEASLGRGLTGARPSLGRGPHWGEASLGRGPHWGEASLGRGLTGARPHWGEAVQVLTVNFLKRGGCPVEVSYWAILHSWPLGTGLKSVDDCLIATKLLVTEYWCCISTSW